MKKELIKFIKFNAVGILNTIVDVLVYWLLNGLLFVRFDIAQVISYICGMLNSWILNSRWTFKGNKRTVIKGLKFIFVNLISLGGSVFILYICKTQWHLEGVLAKLIATPFSLVVNFIGNRLFVFDEKESHQ